MNLRFRPIDLDSHSEIAIRFRADSFFASFGHDRDFWGEDRLGGKRYIDWLRMKLNLDFPMAFHAWNNDEIIGQLEFDFYNGDKSIGYVNLYYLAPKFRGTGISKALDEFTLKCFESLSVKRILLSVSPTNERALSYYKKNSWIDLGPRFREAELKGKKIPQVHLMERRL